MNQEWRTVLLLAVAGPLVFLAAFGGALAPVLRGTLGGIAIIIAVFLASTTPRAIRRLNRRKMQTEAENARRLLASGEFLDAAFAFQRAITLGGDHPRAKLGLAYCIERAGHLEAALNYYADAKFWANSSDDGTLLSITDYYVRALARSGTSDRLSRALEVAGQMIARFKDKRDVRLDELKLGHAYLLLALGREKDARQEFESLSHSASDPSVRERAARGTTAAGLVQLAREGPEAFFKFLGPDDGILH